MKNNNKGFTLMELLIVVAIIGLLASMILVGLSSFRSRGRDARRVADVKQVQNGLEIYYASQSKYPLVSYSSALDSWNNLGAAFKIANIGISQVPQDPLGEEHSYGYASDPDDGSNPQSYIIAVLLEDSSNQSLKNDLDGTIFGVDCGDANADTIYCVQF
jgi:prepilin-type N-terminal cleavage/methylation domain-containing protein